jgi:hypothetical protein
MSLNLRPKKEKSLLYRLPDLLFKAKMLEDLLK